MNGMTGAALRRGLLGVLAVTSLPTAAAHAGLLDKLKSAIHDIPANGQQKVERAAADAVHRELDGSPPARAGSGSAATDAAQVSSAPARTAENTAGKAASVEETADWRIPEPPNWGTSKGTEAILKTTPTLSAGAFYIGMPADDAIAKMKSLGIFRQNTDHPDTPSFKVAQVPGHTFIGFASGGRPAGTGNEWVQLNFTMYPNQRVVSAIRRTLDMEKAEPTVANTVAALRKKYGPEIDSEMTSRLLYWAFDYQGHRLSKAQWAKLKYFGGLATTAGFSGPVIQPDAKVTTGYPVDSPDYHDAHSVVNYSAIVVRASISSKNWHAANASWDSVASDLVPNLVVAIWDAPLDFSASTVSHDLAVHHAEIEKQNELRAAKQRAVPGL